MVVVIREEWEAEGEIAASVFVDAYFVATIENKSVCGIELNKVVCTGVTFVHGKNELICSGDEGNPDLQEAVRDWFASRFVDEHDSNPHLQMRLRNKAQEKAVQNIFEGYHEDD